MRLLLSKLPGGQPASLDPPRGLGLLPAGVPARIGGSLRGPRIRGQFRVTARYQPHGQTRCLPHCFCACKLVSRGLADGEVFNSTCPLKLLEECLLLRRWRHRQTPPFDLIAERRNHRGIGLAIGLAQHFQNDSPGSA
jgi:hypothetical protein